MTKLEELEKLIIEAYKKVYSPSDCEDLLDDAVMLLNKINKSQEQLYRTVGIRAYKLIPREVHGILLDELIKGDKYGVRLLTYDIACAKKILYLFEREYPNDFRPREAIQAAERFLQFKINNPEIGYKIVNTKEHEEVNKKSLEAREAKEKAQKDYKFAARNAASCAASAGGYAGNVADKAASALAWSRLENHKADNVTPYYVDYEPFLRIIQRMLNEKQNKKREITK